MTKIIAEVCQNHNGDHKRLGEMVAEAARCGADIVKMQSIFSADLTKRDRFEKGETDENGAQKTIKRPYHAEFQRLQALDLSPEDHLFFIEKCDEFGVIPMTTIFTRHRVREIGQLPWTGRMIKVASYDCASPQLLRDLGEFFDHFIISTGATYDDEIRETANLMENLGKRFSFLHCVTSYPNTLEMANLRRMEWLKQYTKEAGWSDHSLVERDGIIMAKIAMMLGADFIERHFTILEKDGTKDGPVSITPDLLKELSDFRNLSKEEQRSAIEKENPDWEIALGEPTRDMSNAELLNRDYYRGRFASPVPGGWIYNWEEK